MSLEDYDDEDQHALLTKKDSMQDSEMTPATETGSISEEENTGSTWLGMGAAVARSFRDVAPPAIGGIASFLHKSALTVAAEIASLEREAQLETERWREEQYGKETGEEDELHLPWEVPHLSSTIKSSSCETIYEENDVLMHKILELSSQEETFLGEEDDTGSEEEDEDTSFSLDEPRINLIRRLLELDDNLAAMHAKLSGRSDVKETRFWRNYFCHCERVRREHLEQLQQEQVDVNSLDSASGAASLGSLVPAEQQDDSSYEVVRNSIASPPSSSNTVHTDLSVDDMVLVRAELKDLDKSG